MSELFKDKVKASLVSEGTLLGRSKSKLTNSPRLIFSNTEAGIAGM